MKIFFQSLGCPKNQVDSEIMIHALLGSGHKLVENPEGADLAVVNTCCFIESATQETIDTVTELLELKERHLLGALVVAGCIVGRYREELMESLPDVDLFLGPGTGGKISELIENLEKRAAEKCYIPETPDIEGPRVVANSNSTAYLRISEGCSRNCTYCVIPSIRGKLRSRSAESIISEARDLAGKGISELVIIAEDSSAYGQDLTNGLSLAALLAELDQIDGIQWIRLLYLYPEGVTDQLIDTIRNSRTILPYLDMPFQHGSPAVLKKMGRKIRPGGNTELVKKLRAQLPGLVIRSSFIVGFPGETTRDFQILKNFIIETGIERVGVFEYSREEGTPAAEFPNQTRRSTKEARYRELMEAASVISLESNRTLLGTRVRAMVETPDESGLWRGRIWSQAPSIDGHVLISGADVQDQGKIITIEITEADVYDLKGKKISW